MIEKTKHINLPIKLLAIITERDEIKRLTDILTEKRVYFHYIFNAMGTANSEILKAFGLSGGEKIVCFCVENEINIKPLMMAVVERLEFVQPGNGIAFIMPISGISAMLSNLINTESGQNKERRISFMDNEVDLNSEETKYELIVSIINQGFSEELMEAAKTAGARGGTIIHARRMGIEDTVKFFGISLQAEKEIVAIIINRKKKIELMQAINNSCGIQTEAHGIIISLPVESCAGIASFPE